MFKGATKLYEKGNLERVSVWKVDYVPFCLCLLPKCFQPTLSHCKGTKKLCKDEIMEKIKEKQ